MAVEVTGTIRELQAEGGPVFSCRVVLDLAGGGSRVLQFAAAAPDARLRPGDRLDVRLVENPVGEEVVFCRNATTRQVLVDRVHHQAGRMAWTFLAGCVAVALGLWLLLGTHRL